MAAARVMVYLIGVTLVIVAAWMLFFQTGLNQWIPLGIAAAALLLIIGVSIMGASEKMEEPQHTHGPRVEHEEIHEHHHEH